MTAPTTDSPTAPVATAGAAELLQEFFARFGAGDRAAVLELFTDETDWNVAGSPSVPWTGRRRTRAEIDAFLGHAYSLVDTEAFAVDRVLADGDDAVAFGSFAHRVKATGKLFSSAFALHIAVSGGRIRLYHMFEDSHAADEAFTA